jgi:hypothetical protein
LKTKIATIGALLAVAMPARAQVNVTTFHNDNMRTGWNAVETILKPSLVNTSNFKVLFKRTLDDPLYSQPLYLSGIGSPPRNVVYATTLNNSVYAFDADDAAGTQPLWSRSLGTPIRQSDLNDTTCGLVSGDIGIVSTPVIDATTGTMYLVAMTHEGSSFIHRLYALDVVTGADKIAPKQITFPGFDGLQDMQRAALALASGRVYVTYSSHCDVGSYHGYILEFDAATLTQGTMVFNATASGNGGAIWQSGNGPVIDSAGNLFAVTSNGDWDGTSNFSESFIKLNFDPSAVDSPGHTLALGDFFTPTNWATLNAGDKDINVSGPLYLPTTHLIVDGDKQGRLYLVDASNMGHLASAPEQTLQAGDATNGVVRSLVYFASAANGPLIYMFTKNDVLKSFHFNGTTLDPGPFRTGSYTSAGSPGGILSVSSNVGSNGIVWANEKDALRAYDADNLGAELWNSTQTAGDACGTASKNAPPTIANGKVYLASLSNQLCVYGLVAPPAPTNLTATPGNSQVTLAWNAVAAATSYTVFRGTTTGGPYGTLVSGLTTTGTVDSTALNGTKYFYVVRAVGPGGTSGNSNEASATPGAASVVLPAVADAYVRDGTNAGLNFGTTVDLQVKNTTQTSNTRHAYLRFDLSTVAANVSNAKLRLFGSHPSGSWSDNVYAITNNGWGETTITFSNAPALPGSALASTPIGITAQYYEWDVTSFVASQKTAGVNLVSFAVAGATPITVTQDTFNSRQATSNQPQLVVVASGSANAPPTVATPAAAAPNPVAANTTALSVLGADDGGEAALTYTWATTGAPPAAVTFSANGTNAAKNCTATFTKAGAYNLQATIRDASGATVTSSVAVTVAQTLTSIAVSPASASVAPNGTQQFNATAKDQFGGAISPGPTIGWSVSGGGSIGAGGLFTAGGTAGGPFTVTATSGAVSGTASVTVASASTVTLAPTADAHVRDGTKATTNFGAAIALEVKNTTQTSNTRHLYIKFNISTVGSTVSSAKLRLFGGHTAGTAWSDSVYPVGNTSWSESTITWNTAPAIPGPPPLATTTLSLVRQWWEWDITSYVKAQKAAGATQITLAVTMDNPITVTQDSFVSKEDTANAANKPQLVVTSGP